MKRYLLTAATLTTSAMLAASASAAITYVDAVSGASGNTSETGELLSNTNWASATEQNQGLWQERTVFGNDGNIFQAWFQNSVPEINTQITGLADGPYDVWVFFWDAPGANVWGIDAGLSSGNLTRYSFDGAGDTTSPVAASTLTFTDTTMVTEGDRIMYGVNLGQVSVSSGSAIDVYIDGSVVGSNDRVWYDGVGYELVPEPSSLALLGLGGLLVARRRRD